MLFVTATNMLENLGILWLNGFLEIIQWACFTEGKLRLRV